MPEPKAKLLLIVTYPYSAMIDACAVITALMELPENNFQLIVGCWKFNIFAILQVMRKLYKNNMPGNICGLFQLRQRMYGTNNLKELVPNINLNNTENSLLFQGPFLWNRLSGVLKNPKTTSLFKKIRSSRPEVFLRKGVLKICSKFTGEYPCWSVISIILQNNFIEIALCHGCSPVNLLHILRTPFPRNTSGWLLLKDVKKLSLRFKFVPANISCFPRRLQRNTFRLPRPLEDVFKTSWKRICNTSS